MKIIIFAYYIYLFHSQRSHYRTKHLLPFIWPLLLCFPKVCKQIFCVYVKMQTKQLNVGLHQSCDLCDRLFVIGIDGWFLNFQTITFRSHTVGSTQQSPHSVDKQQTEKKSINDALLLIRLPS